MRDDTGIVAAVKVEREVSVDCYTIVPNEDP
jgi:hypothetical protein